MLSFDPAAIRALTFDCYGTLIDWEAGLLSVLQPWALTQHLQISDDDLLRAFSESELVIESENPSLPYRQLLPLVFDRIAGGLGRATDADIRLKLGNSIGQWPPFSDSPAALSDLQRRFKLIVVSNVDRVSFAGSAKQLGVVFDGLVTAEDVGAYKPDLRMFLGAMEAAASLGVRQSEVLHVAESLYHDHVPAKSLGLKTVWVHRRRGREGFGATRPPDRPVVPDVIVGSLRELADLLGC